MTIQEAIQTGRPFRRPKTLRDQPCPWFELQAGLIVFSEDKTPPTFGIAVTDLIASDWEVKNSFWPGEEFYLAPGNENQAYVLSLENPTTHAYKDVVKVKIIEESKWIKTQLSK